MVRTSPVLPLLSLISPFPPSVFAQCPNMCSRRGTCLPDGQCDCAHGFGAGDCSLRSCPVGTAFGDIAAGDDDAHSPTECSGRGICDRVTGTCRCSEGFAGVGCERTACDCRGRGVCLSMRDLASTTRGGMSESFNYDHVWDADKIYGCVCDVGYAGYDCSQRVCPAGDDPMTLGGVQEVQLLRCSADAGEMVLYFGRHASSRILSMASAADVKTSLEAITLIRSVFVTFSEGYELCRSNVKNIVSIIFLDNFGPLPPLVAETFDMGGDEHVEIRADDSIGVMMDDNGVTHHSVKGTKENDECSNRGVCNQGTGTCLCFDTGGDKYAGSDGYGDNGDRGDCGHDVTAISLCPGVPPCSSRGVCDMESKRCTCEEGFTGGDCSIRVCDFGWSWFSYPSGPNAAHDKWVECSNRGICNQRSGHCYCDDGFFGASCQYSECQISDK